MFKQKCFVMEVRSNIPNHQNPLPHGVQIEKRGARHIAVSVIFTIVNVNLPGVTATGVSCATPPDPPQRWGRACLIERRFH